MFSELQEQHQWLQKLVGEWTYESTPETTGDGPAKTYTGTESVRSIGVLWVIAEGQGEMGCGGGEATTVLTVGYDPEKGRFVGTWLGSMMTQLWLYDGELNAEGTTLTLESQGPSMAGDRTLATYRDVIEFVDDDYRIFHSTVQEADGNWMTFMKTHYRRKTA